MNKRPAVGASMRDQQRAFTRDRLIAASAEVFAHKGYSATTIDDIVSAAGASRATFYLHFHAKREVLDELSARMLPEVQKFYEQLDGVLLDGSHEALHDWMGRAIDWMASNYSILQAMDTAHVDSGTASLQETLAYASRMPRYLASWPEASQRQARTRIILLSLHFGALYSYFRQSQDDRGDLSTGEITDTMTDIWSAALKLPGRTGNGA